MLDTIIVLIGNNLFTDMLDTIIVLIGNNLFTDMLDTIIVLIGNNLFTDMLDVIIVLIRSTDMFDILFHIQLFPYHVREFLSFRICYFSLRFFVINWLSVKLNIY